MQARVTAILVARNGAQYLPRTIAALQSQTRHIDSAVFVDVSSTDETAALLAAASPTQFVTAKPRSSFGGALAQTLKAIGPASDENEWLWLLSADNAPAPGALAALLGAVEIAPSVAVAGPKIMRWDRPDTIASFGETMTDYGRAVRLVHDELDQAQHDRQDDLLAVAAGGMLVRRTVWAALGGFDPGLPTVDDALDFCVRARLAGHRVVAVPAARVAADLAPETSGAVRRAQLHRRLVYAPAAALPFHWLSLVPFAVGRSVWHLATKHPGAVAGELGAGFAAAFDGGVAAARRSLSRSRTLGWAAIAPLRVQPGQARELAANRASAASSFVATEIELPRPSFFGAGGAWIVLLLAAVSVIANIALLGSAALTGGGLLPLSATVGELWSHITWGSDPFTLVLAVLGTLTFWAPSTSIVVLWVVAIPLAGLAAWTCAARFSVRGWAPAVAAVLWALAPPFLASLNGGHVGAVLAHVLLPWLVLAGVNAVRSWSATGAAAILFAAVVASVPSLGIALGLAWLAWLAAHPRSIHRLLGIVVPAIVLFAPLVVLRATGGGWLGLLADPGLPVVGGVESGWQLALGSPDGGSNGWTAVAASVGLPPFAALVVAAALLAPIAALALLALFLPGARRSIPALAVALVGFVTAVVAAHLQLSHLGAVTTAVWPGGALSLYWIGLVGAVVFALEALGASVALPAMLSGLGAVVLAGPLIAAPLAGLSPVTGTDAQLLPAFVAASASTDPHVGTLELTAQPDGSLVAVVHRGAGTTLDEQSTLVATDTAISTEDARLATLAGNLAAHSGFDDAPELDALGVAFVLLPDAEPGAAQSARTRAADALDANENLTAVGATDYGYLWRYAEAKRTTAPPIDSTDVGVRIADGVVLGLALLLAIPTGTRRRPVAASSTDENPADTFEEDESA